ncbi:hypothetical protein [Rubinisphaera sp.]|uniref:hypothetical protein n=1 Tax=Rubinisphaera sp. TaxID=2024857 RepID=UPI0025FB04D9|nr:hypothetical protein [Rubinisphaera sp.]|tara:strand:+ start:2966 stop:3286 length:321 start_codon:yes stop_codon:yes gene_type:complete
MPANGSSSSTPLKDENKSWTFLYRDSFDLWLTRLRWGLEDLAWFIWQVFSITSVQWLTIILLMLWLLGMLASDTKPPYFKIVSPRKWVAAEKKIEPAGYRIGQHIK